MNIFLIQFLAELNIFIIIQILRKIEVGKIKSQDEKMLNNTANVDFYRKMRSRKVF